MTKLGKNKKGKGKSDDLRAVNPARRWQITVAVGAAACLGLYFGLARPSQSKLAALEAQLVSAQAKVATVSAEIEAASSNGQDDLDAVRAKVETLDRQLPYYAPGVTGSLSSLFIDVQALVSTEMSTAVSSLEVNGAPGNPREKGACSALPGSPFAIVQVSNASDLTKPGAETSADGQALSARWTIRANFSDPIAYSAEEAARCVSTGENPRTWEQMHANAFASLSSAVKSLENIEPLFVVTEVTVQAPIPPSTADMSDLLPEPLFTVEITGETYVATVPGLAQVVPAPVPLVSLVGYELVLDNAGGVAPGVSSYQNAAGQTVRLTVLPPNVLPPTGAETVTVLAPDDVLTSDPDGKVVVAVEVSGELPVPLSEFQQLITIQSYAKTQQQVVAGEKPGA